MDQNDEKKPDATKSKWQTYLDNRRNRTLEIRKRREEDEEYYEKRKAKKQERNDRRRAKNQELRDRKKTRKQEIRDRNKEDRRKQGKGFKHTWDVWRLTRLQEKLAVVIMALAFAVLDGNDNLVFDTKTRWN